MWGHKVVGFVLFLCFARAQEQFENNLEECSRESYQLVPVAKLLEAGQRLPGDSGSKSIFPCWFDLNLARAGQGFARQHFGQVFLAHIYSLLALLADQQTRSVLVMTKRSDSPNKAYKRYIATAQHIHLWYHQDILDPAWSQSVRTIRSVHEGVASYVTYPEVNNRTSSSSTKKILINRKSPVFTPNEKLWKAFELDLKSCGCMKTYERNKSDFAETKRPFNQFTMSMTLWSFMALPILSPRQVGISVYTERQLQGFAHLWAVIGYGLGMEEKFIFCKNVQEWSQCKKYMIRMFEKYFLPQLFHLDSEGHMMIEALLRAANRIVPPYPLDALLIDLLERIVGIPRATHLRGQQSLQSTILGLGGSFFLNQNFSSRFVQWIINALAFGEIQIGSLNTFGNPGTNASVVAQTHLYLGQEE